MSDVQSIIAGVGMLLKGSFLTAVDGYQAVTDDKNRALHISALALDILVLLGASLLIAGGATGAFPLVIGGAVTVSIAGFSRFLLYFFAEKPNSLQLSPLSNRISAMF